MTRHWTEKDVAQQFENAVTTLKRLPSAKVQGYVNGWPEVVRTRSEINRGEPTPLRFYASPDQITKMENTLTWIVWVDEDERRLIWHRAARQPWKSICWELGCDRSTAWRKWNTALAKIAALLNEKQTFVATH